MITKTYNTKFLATGFLYIKINLLSAGKQILFFYGSLQFWFRLTWFISNPPQSNTYTCFEGLSDEASSLSDNTEW